MSGAGARAAVGGPPYHCHPGKRLLRPRSNLAPPPKQSSDEGRPEELAQRAAAIAERCWRGVP